jgi:hypothetical protein
MLPAGRVHRAVLAKNPYGIVKFKGLTPGVFPGNEKGYAARAFVVRYAVNLNVVTEKTGAQTAAQQKG